MDLFEGQMLDKYYELSKAKREYQKERKLLGYNNELAFNYGFAVGFEGLDYHDEFNKLCETGEISSVMNKLIFNDAYDIGKQAVQKMRRGQNEEI